MIPPNSIYESDFSFVIRQSRDKKFTSNQLTKFSEPLSENNSRHFQIAQIFYPVISLLRIAFSCPVIISKNKNRILYELKYFSLIYIYTVFGGIFIGGLFSLWCLNSMLHINWPARIFRNIAHPSNVIGDETLKTNELIDIVQQVKRISVPFGAWLIMTLQWTNVKYICKFLNGWADFLHDFDLAFRASYEHRFRRLVKYRNLYFIVWLTPALLLSMMQKPANFFYSDHPLMVVLGYAYCYFHPISAISIRACYCIKDYLMLQTIKVAYEEIQSGISVVYDQFGQAITTEQIDQWIHLVALVRKQASYLRRCMCLSNLWSVFEVFVSILTSVALVLFLLISNKLGSVGREFLPFAVITTFLFGLGLYWKASIVEGVIRAEEAIANDILELETRKDEEGLHARLLMMQICDLIYNDPINLKIGNLLMINKRLILSFSGQLASYLVVILQFHRPT